MLKPLWIVAVLACLFALIGCVSQSDIAALKESNDVLRDAIVSQPVSPQQAKALAVVDANGRVIQQISDISNTQDIGGAVSAAAPLAGPYAPWVTLAGGVLTTLGVMYRQKRREDDAFDEGVKRGSAGDVKPAGG